MTIHLPRDRLTRAQERHSQHSPPQTTCVCDGAYCCVTHPPAAGGSLTTSTMSNLGHLHTTYRVRAAGIRHLAGTSMSKTVCAWQRQEGGFESESTATPSSSSEVRALRLTRRFFGCFVPAFICVLCSTRRIILNFERAGLGHSNSPRAHPATKSKLLHARKPLSREGRSRKNSTSRTCPILDCVGHTTSFWPFFCIHVVYRSV